MNIVKAVLATTLLLLAAEADAYVGPGAGLSALGAVWGLIAAVGTAVVFVLLWPIRALLRRVRGRRPAEAQPQAPAPHEPPR